MDHRVLCSVCRNLVGSKAAISRSSIAGRRRQSERSPEIIAEFVRLNVDVMVVGGIAVPAAKRTTSCRLLRSGPEWVILDIRNGVIPQLLHIDARTMGHFDNPFGERGPN